MTDLSSKTIAVFIENYFDDREFLYPTIRLEEAGAKVIVAGTAAKTEYHSKAGYIAISDVAFKALDADKLDGVIIPGGFAPDFIRRDTAALDIVRKLNEQKKMVAFICHAGWVAISANILKGVKATSVRAIKDDMVNAGTVWQDVPAMRDEHIISAMSAPNVAQFMKEVVAYLASK
ncbi:type 1 glutamine amidotransferase domain-containing protein [Deferribacterales bacterium RsTz2092]|nr:protease [Deferribacterales bacterium]